MTRVFGTIGPALICVLLMWAGVLDHLVDCAVAAESARDASATSLPSEASPLYRYITSHVQGVKGTSFCDASVPEHHTALGQAPARADGFAVSGEALRSLLESSRVREAWAARPVPRHIWPLPPEPPPQGKK